jgi:choline dehydrogenase
MLSDPPRIDAPTRREPSDRDRLAAGYRRGWEVASRAEIRRLCAGPLPPEIHDAKEVRRTIRQNASCLPHVVATCAMGPSPNDGAVVDASGRVYGMEKLFVVAASIMPTALSGVTHLPRDRDRGATRRADRRALINCE